MSSSNDSVNAQTGSIPICWICHEQLGEPETLDEKRERNLNPIHPCQCSLVAHVSCLLAWIGRAEDRRCPQCHSNFLIIPDPSFPTRVLNRGYAGVVVLSILQEEAATLISFMARKALYGGALLYMFLGPEIFCVYFGNSLAEWVHHSAGFFLLSAVFQSFETPVTQDYLRAVLPVVLAGVHYFSKEGLGNRSHWLQFPPLPAVTLFLMPIAKYLWDRYWDDIIRRWTNYDWFGSPGFARFLLDIHRVPGRTFLLNDRDDIRLAADEDLPDWADDDSALQLPADRRAKTIGTVFSVTLTEALPFVGWFVGRTMKRWSASENWVLRPLKWLMMGFSASARANAGYVPVEVAIAKATEAGLLPKPGLASLLRPSRFAETLQTVEPVWWHMAVGMGTWILITDFLGLFHLLSALVDHRNYRRVINSRRPASFTQRETGRFIPRPGGQPLPN